MDERWLPVLGFEGRYEVSDRGRVRSLDRVVVAGNQRRRWKGRILVGGWSHGYPQVILGAGTWRTVHRLVVEAFIGPIPDGMQVRHLDGNPANNHLSNLAIGTQAENTQDRVAHGTMPRGERNPRAKLTADVVRSIRAQRSNGRTIRSLAAEYGVAVVTVSRIVRNVSWRHL
jgi:hypothetical protein